MENFESYLSKQRKENQEKEKQYKETIEKLTRRSENTKEFEAMLEGSIEKHQKKHFLE